MTKDDIIRMAREAEMGFDMTAPSFIAELERFAALVEAAERKKWILAIDTEMVCCHLGVFNENDDPKDVFNKLLAWHQQVALDPLVSAEARKLIEDEREACAKVCENLVIEHPGRADLTADQCATVIRGRHES